MTQSEFHISLVVLSLQILLNSFFVNAQVRVYKALEFNYKALKSSWVHSAFAFCLCFRLVIHFYYTPFYFTIAIPKIVNNGDSNFWMDCSQVDTCQKLIFVFALGVYNIDIDITHSNSITQSTRHTYK